MTEKVLIIEDNLEWRKIVSKQLQMENYNVIAAEDGRAGLEAARAATPPSLILLDVALPGELTGFQVCQMLQNESSTAHIPVIFLTAHSTLNDKLMGFEAGGIDYLPKPFTMPELLARVKANLRRRAGEKHRSQAIIDDYRTNLSQNVSHELRTPLAKLRAALGLLEQEMPQSNRPHLREILDYAQVGAVELQALIEDLLLVNLLTNSDLHLSPEPVSLTSIVERVWQQVQAKYQSRELVLLRSVPNDMTLYIDEDHIFSILKHLIDNACKFSPKRGQILLTTEHLTGEGMALYLHNGGITIDPTLHQDIFEKFFQANMSTIRPQDGLGVGLYIARNLARAYGGDVTLVKSSPQAGTTFRLYFDNVT